MTFPDPPPSLPWPPFAVPENRREDFYRPNRVEFYMDSFRRRAKAETETEMPWRNLLIPVILAVYMVGGGCLLAAILRVLRVG